ncbi:MAG TPA: hypothetical protein VG889_09935 [Rhizomicrobium sp.]|nr:hypothetical protein [Rhizomicrobium sp.]
MHWVTVFDLDQAGFTRWSPVLGGLLVRAFGCIVATGPESRRVTDGVILAIGVLISVVTAATSVWGYLSARSALHKGAPRSSKVRSWTSGPYRAAGRSSSTSKSAAEISPIPTIPLLQDSMSRTRVAIRSMLANMSASPPTKAIS